MADETTKGGTDNDWVTHHWVEGWLSNPFKNGDVDTRRAMLSNLGLDETEMIVSHLVSARAMMAKERDDARTALVETAKARDEAREQALKLTVKECLSPGPVPADTDKCAWCGYPYGDHKARRPEYEEGGTLACYGLREFFLRPTKVKEPTCVRGASQLRRTLPSPNAECVFCRNTYEEHLTSDQKDFLSPHSCGGLKSGFVEYRNRLAVEVIGPVVNEAGEVVSVPKNPVTEHRVGYIKTLIMGGSFVRGETPIALAEVWGVDVTDINYYVVKAKQELLLLNPPSAPSKPEPTTAEHVEAIARYLERFAEGFKFSGGGQDFLHAACVVRAGEYWTEELGE